MPCYDGREDEDHKRTKDRLDQATRAACTMGRILFFNQAECARLIRGAPASERPDVEHAVKWWLEHQEGDTARRATEAREKPLRESFETPYARYGHTTDLSDEMKSALDRAINELIRAAIERAMGKKQ